MTIREYLTKRKSQIAPIKIAGMAVFFFGIFGKEQFALIFVGFAAIFLCTLYSIAFFNCPICNKPIGRLADSTFNLFAFPANVKACPYCATDLDTQMPGSGNADGQR